MSLRAEDLYYLTEAEQEAAQIVSNALAGTMSLAVKFAFERLIATIGRERRLKREAHGRVRMLKKQQRQRTRHA